MQQLSPTLVCLERTRTRLKQGCHVYIGGQRSDGGWKQARSKWDTRFCDPSPSDRLAKYEAYVRGSPKLMGALPELEGKVLGCHCPRLDHCHGSVLVRLYGEQFPDHKVDPALAERTGSVKGVKDNGTGIMPQKRTERKIRLKFRDQDTNLAGIRHNKKDWPWPPLTVDDCIYVDETGYGAWAGPLHVCAARIKAGFSVKGLHDSKLLKKHELERRYEELLASEHIVYHVEAISNTEIDRLGLGEAWRQGVRRAVAEVDMQCPGAVKVIVDGNKSVSGTGLPLESQPLADRTYAAAAAAAILAKVSRDRWMHALAKDATFAAAYPDFVSLFETRVGYGDGKRHMELVRNERKMTPYHRRSFMPMKALGAPKWVRSTPVKARKRTCLTFKNGFAS